MIPKSERLVLEVLELLWASTLPEDLDREGAIGDDGCEDSYEALDDATVLALVQLFKSDEDMAVLTMIKNAKDSKAYRDDYGLEGYWRRSLHLLEDILMSSSSQVTVQKALSGSQLPPELTMQVEAQLTAAKNVPPLRDIESIWGATRPEARCITDPPPPYTRKRYVYPEWDFANRCWFFPQES